MSSPENRSSAERNRKRRALNNFIHLHPEARLCSSDIKRLTDMYREWKNACNSMCGRAFSFSRKVLYYIAERMYCSRFQESSYVKLVLLYIFEVNTTMIVIIFPTESNFPSLSVAERCDFMEYFLKHAYRQKILFGGYRLPSTFICHRRPPHLRIGVLEDVALNLQLLRPMLRFGAMLSYNKNDSQIQESERRVVNDPLSWTIERIQELNPALLPFKDLHMPSEQYRKYASYVNCCKLILKDVSQMSLNELYDPLFGIPPDHVEEEEEEEDIVKEFIRKFNDNIIHDFQNHFIMPLSLKRISCLVIRRQLNLNWELPNGIYELPLPERLKIYLDVQ